MFVQIIIVDSRLRRILLVRHKIGEMSGYHTGLLGEINEDEAPQEAAIRIAHDMCGISVQKAELRAVFESRLMTLMPKQNTSTTRHYSTVGHGKRLISNRSGLKSAKFPTH